MAQQTILRIDLPIQAVWDRITDFSSYRHWHPSYITVVEWARGGVLDVLWQSNRLGKSLELQARVRARIGRDGRSFSSASPLGSLGLNAYRALKTGAVKALPQ